MYFRFSIISMIFVKKAFQIASEEENTPEVEKTSIRQGKNPLNYYTNHKNLSEEQFASGLGMFYISHLI